MVTIECPQCHHKNPDDAEFCEQCGAELPAPVGSVANGASATATTQTVGYAGQIQGQAPADDLICPKCKAPFVPGDVFCFNCGNDLRNLPGNQQAATVAIPTGASAAPNSGQVAPGPQPAANSALSVDDWDKAFENPAAASGATTATGPASQSVANQMADPQAPASSAGTSSTANAFAAPPAPTTVNNPAQVSSQSAPATSNRLILSVTGPYGNQTVEYVGRELLLGRNDAKTRVFPDVNLDDSAASRRHLSIWYEDSEGQFYVQDLESANGTNLNGQDIETGVPIKLGNNDIIKVGTRYSMQAHIS